MMDRRHAFGLLAEYCVMVCYIVNSYTIVQHRFKNPHGELDIVAVRGRHLVVCEVKARKTLCHDEVITQKQLKRLQEGAEFFLATNPRFQCHQIRFDLAVVFGDFSVRMTRNIM